MFGGEQTSVHLYQAYELICRDSLAPHPGTSATLSSTLNHKGTPVQIALALGRSEAPLQFLGETRNPSQMQAPKLEFIGKRLRKLSAPLEPKGDLDSLAGLIHRSTGANVDNASSNLGGTFWIGANYAKAGAAGIRIYINGKSGRENEQWSRVDDFTPYFGTLEKQQELRQIVTGKMTPLGMAISLTQDRDPTGRLYLSGYGNSVSYYEDLLRQCSGVQHVDVLPDDDRDCSTQSVVFAVGIGSGQDRRSDMKFEFCGHCLFQSDWESREHCMRWLALQKIDARAYIKLLEVIAGQVSPDEIRNHIYEGLGGKQSQAYNPIHVTHRPACKTTSQSL
jgi:hypothetical protein